MKRKSKRCTGIVLSVVLCVVCFGMCGCGGEYENAGRGKNGNAVSGGVVSGMAVSGTAVSGSAVESDNKMQEQTVQEQMNGTDGTLSFCTDTNKYYRDEREEVQEDPEKGCLKLMQMRWDGTNKKEILSWEKIDFFYGVAAGWLYYEDAKGNSYRVPVAKDKEGYDVIKEADKEKLFNEKNIIDVLYVDERYMFYQEDNNALITYDLSKRKKVSEYTLPGKGRADYYYTIYIYHLGTCYVAAIDGDGIYVQPDGGTEWSKVSDSLLEERRSTDSWGDTIECIHQNKDVLFYVPVAEDDKSFVCAFDGEKETEFISNQSLQQTVRTAGGFDDEVSFDVCVITDLFIQGERLYIQVQLNWMRGEDYHMEYRVLSQGMGESELRYEKQLTECMQANGQTRKGKWGEPNEWDNAKAEPETVLVDSVIWNDAQCIAMVGGRVYISCYDYKKDKGQLVCYELGTGEYSKVEKNDLRYVRLYDDGTEYGKYEEVYWDETPGIYSDFPEEPTADEYLEGIFYETESK